MADYWKSNDRHFCTFCKCWLASNKISIELHERGNHHKSMVRNKLEQLRKTNIEKEQQEKQLSQTLSQMERAANESFRRDMVSNADNTSKYNTSNDSATSDVNLPSKLKRSVEQTIQVQCKKPKSVIKTPTPKPVFEPLTTTTESKEDTVKNNNNIKTNTEPTVSSSESKESTINNANPEGTWYESKTDTQESFYWNDTTGESTWTPPAVYLSIEQQRAMGLKV